MKIIIVSNLYPPHYKGGYEIRCAQVASALTERGHDVLVLTSVHGLPLRGPYRIRRTEDRVDGVRVLRWLHQQAYGPQPGGRPWSLFEAGRRIADARRFRDLLREFRPDVVNWWSMNGLAKTLLPLPARFGIPDAHWIEHPWMIHEYGPAGEIEAGFWRRIREGEWAGGPLKPVARMLGHRLDRRMAREDLPTRAFPNRPTHVCFVSEYLQRLHAEHGIRPASSSVIHGGVHVDRFLHPIERREWVMEPMRLLYASQISRDRGLDTLIRAIGILRGEGVGLRLTVAGDGDPAFATELRRLAADLGVADAIEWKGRLPHQAMAGLFRQHPILVFPTARPEGLPLTMVEAMLAGCAVVTSAAGGAREVAAAADLPRFAPHDAPALADRLRTLVREPAGLRELAARGQEAALEHFSFDTMLDALEGTLSSLAAETSPATAEVAQGTGSLE